MELRPCRFTDPEVAPLIAGLDGEYRARYDGGEEEMTRSSPEQFDPPTGLFLVTIEDGKTVSGGGFRYLSPGTCEIKRMWTDPAYRRRGYATIVLEALRHYARDAGYRVVRLETGPMQPEAEAMYSRRFRRVDTYGPYPQDIAFEGSLGVDDPDNVIVVSNGEGPGGLNEERPAPARNESLADLVKNARANPWRNQKQFAEEIGISSDTVYQLENGHYRLPTRHRSHGTAVEVLADWLEINVCELVRRYFTKEEISASIFAPCLSTEGAEHGASTEPDLASLSSYVESLPRSRKQLISHSAKSNAEAIAYLIELEKNLDRYEFLVTNLPPFFLFADKEYIRKGSVSVDLSRQDRDFYERIIFNHQRKVRTDVKTGKKVCRVVLRMESFVGFLSALSPKRALRLISEMKTTLKLNAFDLLLYDTPNDLEEFEVLGCRNTFTSREDGDTVSIRHRHIGLGTTLVYQLAVMGTDRELVHQDWLRAESIWAEALQQYRDRSSEPQYGNTTGPYWHKEVTARLLDFTLRQAHPTPPKKPRPKRRLPTAASTV